MVKVNRRQAWFLFLTFLIVMLSFPAVISIVEKADLPISVYSSDNSVYLKQIRVTTAGLKAGDRIISIDGVDIYSREDIEVIMDTKKIGAQVELQIQSGNEVKSIIISAIPFYSGSFIIVQTITCAIFLLLGLFVLLKCPGVRAAELFHLSMLGATTVMIMTWGKVNTYFDFFYITRILFHIAYIFAPILFVQFSLIFPTDKLKRYKYYLNAAYLAGFIILVPNVFAFLKTAANPVSENVTAYINIYNFSRFFMAAMILASIIIFLLRYIHADHYVEKQKLKWLITGFVIGPLSFIILWVLPQAFTDYAFVPEQYVYFLMLSVPVTFTISIVKYHLLDIDFIINRSIVYSAVIIGSMIIYFLIILIVTAFVEDINKTVLSSLSAVSVAFLFTPLKNYVHNFVDRKFFRVQYNFRNAVKAVSNDIKQFNDIYSLSEGVIKGISNLIPVEKIALIDNSDPANPKTLSQLSFPYSDVLFLAEKIFPNFSLQYSIILPEKVEPGIDLFETDPSLKERRINLILVPGNSQEKEKYVLIMGNKKSGRRYSAEDIDLVMNIFNSATGMMERLRIHEEFVRKSLEAEKLQEINQQKSLFVSLVSHELKTPLTSVRMYSELIRMNSDSDKVDNYALYIEGESERLTRLINNVLNYSTIEKGIKEYAKQPVDLNTIVDRSLAIMNYQFNLLNFEIRTDFSPKELLIYADPDAILEILLNLMNNALKYSGSSKIICINTSENNSNYTFEIQDYGLGISEEDQKLLFTPYFRAEQARTMKISGTGIGLSIIKHFADAHNIRVEVQSKLAEGTTFRLIIPKFIRENKYEEHLNN